MSGKDRMARRITIQPYWGPVGGWGSARAVSQILLRERRPFKGPLTLVHQNKPSGYQCVSCSYAKPGDPHPLEFCENGEGGSVGNYLRARLLQRSHAKRARRLV